MKKHYFALLICFTTVFLAAQSPRVVLKTDFAGQVSEGSVEELIEHIQDGKSVRVGWHLDRDDDQKSDLDHWTDAEFISVLNGQVFNQIGPIYRQIPVSDLPQVKLEHSSVQWSAIIGTNGKLIHRYILPDLHNIEDLQIRQILSQRAEIKEDTVATTWVVLH